MKNKCHISILIFFFLIASMKNLYKIFLVFFLLFLIFCLWMFANNSFGGFTFWNFLLSDYLNLMHDRIHESIFFSLFLFFFEFSMHCAFIFYFKTYSLSCRVFCSFCFLFDCGWFVFIFWTKCFIFNYFFGCRPFGKEHPNRYLCPLK